MTPTFKIVNQATGVDYSSTWANVVQEITVTDQSTDHSDTLRVWLMDTGGMINIPQKGENLEVSIGQDGPPLLIGDYVIDEIGIEGPPDRIEIVGKACPFGDAAGWSAMQTRRSRSWDNVTLRTLVNGIAAEHGLKASVAPALANVSIVHVDQTAESNINLLSRLARSYDAVFKAAQGRLVFSGTDGGSMSGPAMPALTITRGPGVKFKCKFMQATDFAAVKAEYHDNSTGLTTAVIAGDEGPTSKVYHDPNLQPDLATAQHHAKSKLKGFRKGSHGLALDLPGMFQVTCEQQITVAGFRPEMNGTWIAKRVEFILQRSTGLRTRLDCEVPGVETVATASPSSSLGGLVAPGEPGAGLLGSDDGTDDEDAQNDGEQTDSTEPTATDPD